MPPPFWRRNAAEIALTLLLVCSARTGLAAPFTVVSGSMQPTLLIGDHMLAEPFAYGYSTIFCRSATGCRGAAACGPRRRIAATSWCFADLPSPASPGSSG